MLVVSGNFKDKNMLSEKDKKIIKRNLDKITPEAEEIVKNFQMKRGKKMTIKMFKQGQCVIHKLTGQHVLILEQIKYQHSDEYGFIDGYYIRTNDYKVIKVANFELKERNSD